MLKYGKNIKYNLEKLDKLNIDRQAVSCISNSLNVLEIGCATGFMGEYLIENKDCRVTGVEFRKEEALIAKKKLNKVIVGDIESLDTVNQIKNKHDVILASAVIEHLKNPWTALKSWRKFLKKDRKSVV